MTRRLLLIVLLSLLAIAALVVGVVVVTGGGSLGIAATVPRAVQTPDGAAGCVARAGGTIVCANDASQGRRTPVALIAGETTTPRALDLRVDWSHGDRLAVGEQRDVGGFRCTGTRTGLVCGGPGGDALAVGATHLSATVAGATYP